MSKSRSQASPSSTIDRLVEAGLVARRPDPGDRRGILVRLTRRGRRAIDAALETHAANEERLLAVLTTAERRTLDRSLRKLLASLERQDVEPAKIFDMLSLTSVG